MILLKDSKIQILLEKTYSNWQKNFKNMLRIVLYIIINLDTYEQNGWPSWGYGISKLLINTYVKTLA